jgi:DUF438 domain-containing protein
MTDVANNEPGSWWVAAVLPFALLGAGVSEPLPDDNGRWDELGARSGTDQSGNRVHQTLERVGIDLRMPERMIRGVKLNDAQYDEYAQRAGKAIQKELANVLRTTRIERLSIGRQEALLRAHIENAREHARTIMLGKHDEIRREAARLKKTVREQGTPAAIRRREAAQ